MKLTVFFYLGLGLSLLPWGIYLLQDEGGLFRHQFYLIILLNFYRERLGGNLLYYEKIFPNAITAIRYDPLLIISRIGKESLQFFRFAQQFYPRAAVFLGLGFFAWVRELTSSRLIFLTTCLFCLGGVALPGWGGRDFLFFLPLTATLLTQVLFLIPLNCSFSSESRDLRLIERIPLRSVVIGLLLFGMLASDISAIFK